MRQQVLDIFESQELILRYERARKVATEVDLSYLDVSDIMLRHRPVHDQVLSQGLLDSNELFHQSSLKFVRVTGESDPGSKLSLHCLK